jgi:hypothetical protein
VPFYLKLVNSTLSHSVELCVWYDSENSDKFPKQNSPTKICKEKEVFFCEVRTELLNTYYSYKLLAPELLPTHEIKLISRKKNTGLF